MVGPAGAGVRRAAGGNTGAGPLMMRGAWALAAREKARAAAVNGGNVVGEEKRKKKGRRDKTRVSISHQLYMAHKACQHEEPDFS